MLVRNFRSSQWLTFGKIVSLCLSLYTVKDLSCTKIWHQMIECVTVIVTWQVSFDKLCKKHFYPKPKMLNKRQLFKIFSMCFTSKIHFEESKLLVLGGFSVHTEYWCIFSLWYEFLLYRHAGVFDYTTFRAPFQCCTSKQAWCNCEAWWG